MKVKKPKVKIEMYEDEFFDVEFSVKAIKRMIKEQKEKGYSEEFSEIVKQNTPDADLINSTILEDFEDYSDNFEFFEEDED